MIPGLLIAPGKLTDPGVNFTSMHGLTPVTVHVSFFIAPGQLRGNFSSCEQNAKVAPGQRQSCACPVLMFGINFSKKSSKKHEKQVNVFKIHSL